jgi:thiosulfate/3-mercaptopyruvate sulfurtransferase
MNIRIATLTFLASGLVFATAVQAIELPGPLVSPEWLKQHRTEVNLLDVRDNTDSFVKPPEFSEDKGKKSLDTVGGHIADALLLDFAKARTARTIDGREIKAMLPERSAFEKLMRETGVKAGRPTVIVSEGMSGSDLDMAARVYWSMKVYGDDHLAILDGGMSAWINAGLPISTDAAKSTTGNWSASAERKQYVAASEDVAAAAKANVQLVDARPMPFYVGLEHKPNIAASGHIGEAVNFPPDVRAKTSDGSQHFISAPEYKSIFSHLGLDPAKPSITYCNTGHLASGAWFVLSEVMKNPAARVYDGSMTEWAAESRPVVGLP